MSVFNFNKSHDNSINRIIEEFNETRKSSSNKSLMHKKYFDLDNNHKSVSSDDQIEEKELFSDNEETKNLTEGLEAVPMNFSELEIKKTFLDILPPNVLTAANKEADDSATNTQETAGRSKVRSKRIQNSKKSHVVSGLKKKIISEPTRRSNRVRVQAHANLKPIYEPERILDFSGKPIRLYKCVGYEKISQDLVKFREKYFEKSKIRSLINKERKLKRKIDSI